MASMDCNVWSSCVVAVSMCIYALKSFTGLLANCHRYEFGGDHVVY